MMLPSLVQFFIPGGDRATPDGPSVVELQHESIRSSMTCDFTYAELDRTEVQGDDSKFVIYCYRVRHGDKSWVISRRYSQFRDLLDKLIASHSSLVEDLRLELPPKRFIGNQDAEVVSVRSFALMNFVNNLGRSRDALAVPMVNLFLEIPRQVRGGSAFTRQCGTQLCFKEGYLQRQPEKGKGPWPMRYVCLTTHRAASDLGCVSYDPQHATHLVLLIYDAKETVIGKPKSCIDLSYLASRPCSLDIIDEVSSTVWQGKEMVFLFANWEREIGVAITDGETEIEWIRVLSDQSITGLVRRKREAVPAAAQPGASSFTGSETDPQQTTSA